MLPENSQLDYSEYCRKSLRVVFEGFQVILAKFTKKVKGGRLIGYNVFFITWLLKLLFAVTSSCKNKIRTQKDKLKKNEKSASNNNFITVDSRELF